MPQDVLESFSRQIADWTRELLEHGRYPFRKVAVRPRVLTPSGVSTPDLVLWVNRPSYMAGGVVFFPNQKASPDYSLYTETAHALGLSYFIVWQQHDIEIRAAASPYSLEARLPIENPTEAQGFRNALTQLLDRIKPLAVIGAIPPGELSAWHLSNLCMTAYTASFPAVLEATRIRRDSVESPSLEYRARNLCWLTLFQLLSLLSFDILPEAVHADRLSRALDIASQSLPPHLRQGFDCFDSQPLPENAAVAYHHLFRRLTQIGWRDDRERQRLTLKCLLRESYTDITGGPDMDKGIVTAADDLLLEPLELSECSGCYLVASPGRLLGLLLQRHLQGLDPLVDASISPFKLPHNLKGQVRNLSGSISSNEVEYGIKTEEELMHLRISWPNQRFSAPRQTPHWMLGLIHLLGFCSDDSVITIHTPPLWLNTRAGHFLAHILLNFFNLEEIASQPEHTYLHMKKTAPTGANIILRAGNRVREVDADWLTELPPCALPLAVSLPDQVWSLIQGGELRYQPTSSLPASTRVGLRRFLTSSLGQLLLETCGLGTERLEGLEEELHQDQLIPLPAPQLLEQLGAREFENLSPEQLSTRVEKELARWLGIELPVATPLVKSSAEKQRARSVEQKELLESVFRDGVPCFPDHYLFDHYRPELESFTLPAPLKLNRRFFSQLELTTNAGDQITVNSELVAHALVLASHGSREKVALPKDETILKEILIRYHNDLRILKERLQEACNRHYDNADKARATARRLWRKQGLPPWETLDIEL